MEYTKDLILNVHYDEVTNTISFNNRKNRLISKMKKHKIIIASIIMSVIFIMLDFILMINFIHILEKL